MISDSDERRMLLLLEEYRESEPLLEEEIGELVHLLAEAYEEQRKQLGMMRG